MAIIFSGDSNKKITLNGDGSKVIGASQVQPVYPSYVIPGVDQSHWLASDAVVTTVSGVQRVSSVPDTSGVGSDVLSPAGISATYRATGWTSGGKTLPTMDFLYAGSYVAQNWAGRLNDYTGAWTIAMLVNLADNPDGRRPVFNMANAIDWQSHFGPVTSGGDNSILTMGRRPQEWANYSFAKFSKSNPGPQTDVNQLWLFEYPGISASTALDQYRWYVNGTLRTDGWLAPNVGNGGRQAMPCTTLYFGGTAIYGASANMAQIHIWKTALTSTQRDDITSYLMNAGGL